jgi:predicted dehydrogenase
MAEVEVLWYRSGKGRSGQAPDEMYGMRVFENLDQAIAEEPDFGIIANPTSLHVSTALCLAKAGIPFLIEKPVSDRLEGLDELKQTVSEENLPVMVGFQLRYHPGYKQLLHLISSGQIGDPMNLQGHVGQYLPEWRPDGDYRQSYSASKDMGGGVILDLCHEIDVAISILGDVVRVCCLCDHYSELQIESEDMAEIIMDHQGRRLSHLHLNYLERNYNWVTRVMGTLGTVVWDYGRGYVELTRFDGTTQRWSDPDGFDRDCLFRDQLRQWLGVLDGAVQPEANLENGIDATRVALAAKCSSRERRHVEL